MQIRLSHKILSISGVGVLGLLILGGVYLSGEANQEAFRQANEAASSLRLLKDRTLVSLLEARRAEKNFLIFKDERYNDEHRQISQRIASQLGELRRQNAFEQGDLSQKLQVIETGYKAYQKHFADMLGVRIRLGLNEDAGLEGALRKSVHEIETTLNKADVPALVLTMLMMRRHEKDFMLRGSAKAAESMRRSAAEFSTQLAASGLSPNVKADLAQKLSDYQRDFSAWVDAAREAADAQSAVTTSFRGMEPAIDAIDKFVQARGEEARSAEEASRAHTKFQMELAVVIISLLAAALGFIISRSVTSPLTAMVATMLKLARGDTTASIPGLGKHDEIGEMASSVQTFKDSMIEADRLRAEKLLTEQQAALQRKIEMNRLADSFQTAVGEIIETVSSASTELEAAAGTLTATAEHAQEVTTTVAAASEEASTNVQSVASATEELTSSVGEIGRQVHEAAQIARHAVDQALTTNSKVSELSNAAAMIGNVVEIINTIAGQTNLLALNATIEAARAGAAGRGFAVVASEVKALAGQTAKATGEISKQIAGIQTATDQSVAAISQITGTISKMSEIASTIASAVEEQGAATQEISRNVQQAAQGTMQVSANIIDVEKGAAETGSASTQLLSAAQSLSRDSNRLKSEVIKFLDTVRAA